MNNNENMNTKSDVHVMESFHTENKNPFSSPNIFPLDYEQFNIDSALNNILKTTGKDFEIPRENADSIFINSSEDIDIEIEYSPRAITLIIKSNSSVTSTELSISGFADIIHKYEDHYSNYIKLTPDKEGKIIFKQDISKNHVVFLQTNASTYILTEAGWNPSNVGTWNPITRKATLIVEGNETIEIQTDDVILNGLKSNNTKYTIDGNVNKLANGIFINGRKKIVICNFQIQNCDTGIRILNSEDIIIKNNTILDSNNYGLYLDYNIQFNIFNNFISSKYMSIYENSYNECVTIKENHIVASQYGIYVSIFNLNTKILNNLIDKNISSLSFIGMYISSLNNHLEIENNFITISEGNYTAYNISFYGLYCTSNNDVTVINNKFKICNNRVSAPANSYVYSYLYGFYVNGFTSTETVIKCNETIFENNTFISENSYMYTNLTGQYLTNNYTGSTVYESNKITIKNNTFSSNPTNPSSLYTLIRGIYCTNSYNKTLIANNVVTISNNTLANPGPTQDFRVYGTILYYNFNTCFNHNLVKLVNNTFRSFGTFYGYFNDYYCIHNLISSNEVKIQNNEGSFFYGMYINRYNRENEIMDNSLSDNQGTGIYMLSYNTENIIKGNMICKNAQNGIYIDAYNGNNKISCNTIYCNGQNGIFLNSQSNKNTIDFNNIIENATGLYIATESNSNCVQFNNFINGENQNAFNYGSKNKFSSNYWSDWNGLIPYNVNNVVDYKPLKHPIGTCEKGHKEQKKNSWI